MGGTEKKLSPTLSRLRRPTAGMSSKDVAANLRAVALRAVQGFGE